MSGGFRSRRRVQAARYGWMYARLVSAALKTGRHELVTANAIVSRRRLREGGDQLAHLIADQVYRAALETSRRRMGIGPDRQMARTVTFE